MNNLTEKINQLSNNINIYCIWGGHIHCENRYGQARKSSLEAKGRIPESGFKDMKQVKKALVILRKAIKEHKALGFTEEYIEVDLDTGYWS